MAAAFLKLSDDTTELVLIGNPNRLATTHDFKWLVGNVKQRQSPMQSGAWPLRGAEKTLNLKGGKRKVIISFLGVGRTPLTSERLARRRESGGKEAGGAWCNKLG